MMKTDYLAWTRARWEEAFSIDPERTIELTLAVLGHEVFAWSSLTTRELRALSAAVFPTCLEGRG